MKFPLIKTLKSGWVMKRVNSQDHSSSLQLQICGATIGIFAIALLAAMSFASPKYNVFWWGSIAGIVYKVMRD